MFACMIRLIVCFLCTTANQVALAASELDYKVPSNLAMGIRAQLVDPAHFEIAGACMTNRGIESVLPVLGSAPEFRSGRHIPRSVCYRDFSGVRVVFDTTAVGFGYTAYASSRSARPQEICVDADAIPSDAKNGTGLRLGLSRRNVQELLGEPTKSDADSIQYDYWMEASNSESELWFDIYSSIKVRFSENIVVEYAVYTSETY